MRGLAPKLLLPLMRARNIPQRVLQLRAALPLLLPADLVALEHGGEQVVALCL
jgi:hypothetical protein